MNYIIKSKDINNQIDSLIYQINQTHEPIIIEGESNSAVLISLEDFKKVENNINYVEEIPNEETIQAMEDIKNKRNLEAITFEQLKEDIKKCIIH